MIIITTINNCGIGETGKHVLAVRPGCRKACMVRVLHTALLCSIGEIGKRVATVKGAMVSNHLEVVRVLH